MKRIARRTLGVLVIGAVVHATAGSTYAGAKDEPESFLTSSRTEKVATPVDEAAELHPYPFGQVYANPGYGPFPDDDHTFRTYGEGAGGGEECVYSNIPDFANNEILSQKSGIWWVETADDFILSGDPANDCLLASVRFALYQVGGSTPSPDDYDGVRIVIYEDGSAAQPPLPYGPGGEPPQDGSNTHLEYFPGGVVCDLSVFMHDVDWIPWGPFGADDFKLIATNLQQFGCVLDKQHKYWIAVSPQLDPPDKTFLWITDSQLDHEAQIFAPAFDVPDWTELTVAIRFPPPTPGNHWDLWIEITANKVACGNGVLDPGEDCDLSASGGDAACPGFCQADCTCGGAVYGDITSAAGVCIPDGNCLASDVDFDDVLCALNGFGLPADCPCADINTGGGCGGGNGIDFDDILAILESFAGNFMCNPQPGGCAAVCGDGNADPSEQCGEPGLDCGSGTFCVDCICVWSPCFANGNCCDPNGVPGCNDTDCCNVVCNADSYCCEQGWDSICVAQACNLCGDLCACGDGVCTFDCGEDWSTCPEDCDVCGGEQAGDCCEPNGTQGCDDADCCDCVCATDPSCCVTVWDQACADATCCGACDFACGSTCLFGNCIACGLEPLCGNGDCCEPNGTPGCGNPDCCDCVCASDPDCCDTVWDQACADATCCGSCDFACGSTCLFGNCIACGLEPVPIIDPGREESGRAVAEPAPAPSPTPAVTSGGVDHSAARKSGGK